MTKKVKSELNQRLKELRLPGILESYGQQAELARRESLSYEQFLLELVNHEFEIRRENRIARHLKDSKLPLEKSLSTFNRRRLPQRVNA